MKSSETVVVELTTMQTESDVLGELHPILGKWISRCNDGWHWKWRKLYFRPIICSFKYTISNSDSICCSTIPGVTHARRAPSIWRDKKKNSGFLPTMHVVALHSNDRIKLPLTCDLSIISRDAVVLLYDNEIPGNLVTLGNQWKVPAPMPAETVLISWRDGMLLVITFHRDTSAWPVGRQTRSSFIPQIGSFPCRKGPCRNSCILHGRYPCVLWRRFPSTAEDTRSRPWRHTNNACWLVNSGIPLLTREPIYL